MMGIETSILLRRMARVFTCAPLTPQHMHEDQLRIQRSYEERNQSEKKERVIYENERNEKEGKSRELSMSHER